MAEINHDLVRRTFNWLVEKQTQWPGLIANFGGSLHKVKSEDLIGNPAGTLPALADDLGLSLDHAATRQSIGFEQVGADQTNLHVKDEMRLRFSRLLSELKSTALQP